MTIKERKMSGEVRRVRGKEVGNPLKFKGKVFGINPTNATCQRIPFPVRLSDLSRSHCNESNVRTGHGVDVVDAATREGKKW